MIISPIFRTPFSGNLRITDFNLDFTLILSVYFMLLVNYCRVSMIKSMILCVKTSFFTFVLDRLIAHSVRTNFEFYCHCNLYFRINYW